MFNEKALQDITNLKPSKLIRVALADLQKCEVSEKYIIDMGTWHEPGPMRSDHCRVCVAGSVIAQTGGTSIDGYAVPADFRNLIDGKIIQDRLLALENLRTSNYQSFLALTGIDKETSKRMEKAIFDFAGVVPMYEEYNPNPFYQTLYEIADFLETEGM